jgi:NAD(P)-dependent dehydrogenase (short-subunit alcohol dehydrogenase family)
MERIRAGHGRLDILVNDVWGGDALTEWGKPFWQIPYADVKTLVERAVLSHVLAAQKAAPLLGKGSLVVEVTDGDGYQYRGQFLYDLVKTTVIRLAFAWHEELSSRGVSSVAVTPGFLRSEAMLDLFGVTERTWRDHVSKDPDWDESETPMYVGRAVAALAADPNVARKSGRVFASWTLAREYGFADADGRRPDWGRHFAKRYGDVHRPADDGFYRYWEGQRELMDAVKARQERDPGTS